MAGPPEGIRVLDFSQHLAGAGATRILGSYGAEILRAEWSAYRAFDFLRTMFVPPGVEGPNGGALFNVINIDKLSFTLNFQHPRGREVALRLARISDVFAENMTPGVMTKYGLGYDDVREARPEVIYLAQSGWGRTGPRAHYRSYGMSSSAHAGIAFFCGLPGRPPAGWQFAYSDHNPAWLNAIGILAAIHHRNQTGEGQLIDVAQTQAAITTNNAQLLDAAVNERTYRTPEMPPGNRRFYPRVAPHNVYRTQGVDEWLVIAVYTDEEWAGLKGALGGPEWAEAERFATAESRWEHQDELDQHLATWCASRNRYAAVSHLQDHGVPAGVVQTPRDKVEWDRQLKHRETFALLDHPDVGPRLYETVAAKLAGHPYRPRQGPPCFGEHNEYVYGELLGLTSAQMAELHEAEVI